MIYNSPILIIADKDLQSADAQTLKRWRKEAMLRFTFGSQSTVEINGVEYDKQTVNDSFTALQEDFSFHLEIFQNKPLLAFLEKGDLWLFSDSDAQEKFNQSVHKEKIFPYFAYRYGKLITQIIENPSPLNLSNLSKISLSIIRIPSEQEVAIFANSFESFNRFTERLSRTNKQIFESDEKNIIISEFSEFVNSAIQNLLRLLPPVFDDLKRKYCHTIRNNILAPVFAQENRIRILLLDVEPLRLLLLAAQISKQHLGLNDTDKIIEIIQGLIDTKTKSKDQNQANPRSNYQRTTQQNRYKTQSNTTRRTTQTHSRQQRTNQAKTTYRPRQNYTTTTSSNSGSGASAVWIIIVAIIFFIRVAILAESCNRSNRNKRYSNSYNYKQRNSNNIYIPKQQRDKFVKRSSKNNYNDAVATNAEFNASDLVGVWGKQAITEGGSYKISYNFKDTRSGERVITFSDTDGSKPKKIIQKFIFTPSPQTHYDGHIDFNLSKNKYENCARDEAMKILGVIEMTENYQANLFKSKFRLYFSIPGNRNNGIALGKDTYKPIK